MNGIFGDLIGICRTVCIDDVQIYTRTFEKQSERLEEVFRRLTKRVVPEVQEKILNCTIFFAGWNAF